MPISFIPDFQGPGVYALIGTDGNWYIGSSKNIHERVKRHRLCMRMTLKHGHSAFVSDKLEDALHRGVTFDCRVLATFGEDLSKQEIEEIERVFIKKHHAFYNTQNINHKV